MAEGIVEGLVLPAGGFLALVLVVLHHEIEQLSHRHARPRAPLCAGLPGLGLAGVKEPEGLLDVRGPGGFARGLRLAPHIPVAVDGWQLAAVLLSAIEPGR